MRYDQYNLTQAHRKSHFFYPSLKSVESSGMSLSELPSVSPIMYAFARLAFRLSFSVFTRVHVEGLDRVPSKSPVILACNHLTWMDGPLIMSRSRRRLRGLAAENYRIHPFGLVLTAVGSIYIHRGCFDRAALRLCLSALNENEALAIAIEGTRNPSTGLHDGKTGVAWLASQSKAPVVPVAVFGTERIATNLRCCRRADVGLVFGNPMELSTKIRTAKDLVEATECIMRELARLLPAQYRGHFK